MQGTPLFNKLNLKAEMQIMLVNVPAYFSPDTEFVKELATLGNRVHFVPNTSRPEGLTTRDPDTGAMSAQWEFILFFATTASEVAHLAQIVAEQSHFDYLVWCAYPKKSSKRYQSQLSRDGDWQQLGALGLEAVRQVAIDDDWSALRFRRVEYITSLQRDPKRLMSVQGKKRATK